jgi:prenyltransferase beta subunit
MLDAARRAPTLLGEAFGPVHDFLWAQLNSDGGFKNRTGQSDIYYTVFGIDCLLALGVDPPLQSLERFVRPLEDGAALEFVPATCLARAWSFLPTVAPESWRTSLKQRILRQRGADGGFAGAEPAGSIASAFAAVSALEDLKARIPEPQRLAAFLRRHAAPAGGYSNELTMPLPSTTASAAACLLLLECGAVPDAATTSWLLARAHRRGGFGATAHAAMPDLRSTGAAVHALARIAGKARPALPPALRERTLDYLDALWSNRGAFHSSWADEALDCEHLFYALLTLGHLAE